jgi:ribonuclease D
VAIWQAIERGQAGDLPPIHQRNQSQVCDEGYEARVDLALAFVKGLCMASQLDPALIGNRAEITALVVAATSDPDCSASPLLSGWRADFCGQDLMAVLAGQGSIGVNPATRFPEYRLAPITAD